MMIRRLAFAMRQQDWVTLCLDLLIVVVGIYLGLQANEWAEEAKSRRQGLEHLTALLSDFQSSSEDLRDALEYKERQIVDIQELLSKGTKDIAEQRLNEIIRRGVYSTNTYIPTISALRDLEASGNLGLISDPTIRRELSQLSYQIDSVDRSFAEYLFFHQHDLDPFIARNLPIVAFLSSASGAPVLEKGEADWSSLDSDLARGLLAFKMSLTHNYTQSLEKLDQLFTNLIAQIETAIQPL